MKPGKKYHAAILAFLLAATLLQGCGQSPSPTLETKGDTVISTAEAAEEAAYVVDTVYEGADVAIECYELPFNHSEGAEYYIKNKDLLQKLPDGAADAYIDTASRYVQTVYGNDWRTIARDAGAFSDELDGFFFEDLEKQKNGEAVSDTDFSNEIADWYVDNEVAANAELKTDKSLLYGDNFLYYLRGELVATYHGGEQGADIPGMGDVFGFDANSGEEIRLIAEFEFCSGRPDRITAVRLIAYIG